MYRTRGSRRPFPGRRLGSSFRKRTRISRIYRRSRPSNGRSRYKRKRGTIRIRRPAQMNQQSKLLVARSRTRHDVQLDPSNTQGWLFSANLDFATDITPAEYGRIRSEILRFRRYRFVGFSVSIKKISNKQWVAGTTTLSPPLASTCQMRGNSDIYADSTFVTANDMAVYNTPNWKTISSKGTKILKYKVPSQFKGGFAQVATSSFWTSTSPSDLPPKKLVYLNIGQNSTTSLENDSINCPSAYIVNANGIPTPISNSLIPSGIQLAHITTFESYINYYFEAYGALPISTL